MIVVYVHRLFHGTVVFALLFYFCLTEATVSWWCCPNICIYFLRVSTCCWISLNTGGGTISWGTTVSLTRRSDTGKLNHSPRSAQLPIVRLQNGCNNTIPIHTDDPDGDEVRCRWAVGAECGGVCRAIPGILIQVSPIILSFY